jgi:hypothetical protein
MQKQMYLKAYGRRDWSSRAAQWREVVVALDRELARLALTAPQPWHSPAWGRRE